ncbi:MAG: choice-of-anchor H family protein [Granulosicoccus sp.]
MPKSKKPVTIKTLALAASLLAMSGTTIATDTPTASSTTESHALHLDDRAWINDIGLLLSGDLDGDGYFSSLSLSIDADSTYSRYEVYVIVNLINEFNVAERFHTTYDFDVYGRSFSDDYRIDIDLRQNYTPGIYDLQIILVDANDNRVLDEANANSFRNLRSLPLESTDNQTVQTPVIDRPVNDSNGDIEVNEYAGSTGFGITLLLIISGLFRLFTHRTQKTDWMPRNLP